MVEDADWLSGELTVEGQRYRLDQVDLLQYDNIVSETAIREKRTLSAFGITPTAMETVLPSYMWRFRKHGQFDRQGHKIDGAAA
jgi:NADH dehydrogenase